MSKKEYLRDARVTYPAPYYRSAEWINQNPPADSRVLIFGGGRSFYIERRLITNSNVDVRSRSSWASEMIRDSAPLSNSKL